MKRRVCETCLYFEPAGFNKTGWCHHPLRRQNSEVRLMVRANELGCRNGWNADLWVPAETDGATQREHPLAPIGDRARAEVAPAEQNDLITSIVAARTDNLPVAEERLLPLPPARAAIEEDIFIRQTPALSRKTGPVSPQPATELVQNPKAAILRARDQFRQRRMNEGRIADRQLTPTPLISSDREARRVDDFDLVEPEPAPDSVDPRYENRPVLRPRTPEPIHERTPISPVSLREIERPFPSMTDFPEDRSRFESIPDYESNLNDEIEMAEAPPVDTWIETRQLDSVPLEPYEVDELFEEDEMVPPAETIVFVEEEEFSVRHRESKLNRFLRQRRERHETMERSIESADTENRAQRTHVEPTRHTRIEIEHQPRSETTAHRPAYQEQTAFVDREISVTRSAPPDESRPNRQDDYTRTQSESRNRITPPTTVDDDFLLPPPLPPLESKSGAAQSARIQSSPRPEPVRRETHPAPRNPDPLPHPVDEFGDQPLFATQPSVARDRFESEPAPVNKMNSVAGYRMERICRTCRSFRPAETGDRGWCTNQWAFDHRRMVDADELSCRTSMGDWWTPKDDVWRRDFDISRHAQQTPRVNELLFGSDEERNDRRRSGS